MKDTLLDTLAITFIAVVILVAVNLVIYFMLFIQGVALTLAVLGGATAFVLSMFWAVFRIIDRK